MQEGGRRFALIENSVCVVYPEYFNLRQILVCLLNIETIIYIHMGRFKPLLQLGSIVYIDNLVPLFSKQGGRFASIVYSQKYLKSRRWTHQCLKNIKASIGKLHQNIFTHRLPTLSSDLPITKMHFPYFYRFFLPITQ